MHCRAEEIPLELEQGELVTRGTECGEIYTRHITLPAGTDFTPLFVGLPGDLCQSPHWGQVLEGAITVRYADGHEETTGAGDIYYWPAGHTGWTDQGVTFVEYSPTDKILPVLEHVSRQLATS